VPFLHAVWQAQGQGCAPGALGVCIGSDLRARYELAKGSSSARSTM